MEFNKYVEKVYFNIAKKTAFENLMSQLIFDGKKVELKHDKKLMTEFALVVDKEIYCELTDFAISENNEKLSIFYNCLMATLLEDQPECNYANDSKDQLNTMLDVIQKEKFESEEKNDTNNAAKCNKDLLYFKNILNECEKNDYNFVDCLKSFNKLDEVKTENNDENLLF